MNSANKVDAALHYASLGWQVFPCTNKKPLITAWPTNASMDRDQIKRWWTNWPDANIGVPTGQAAGFFAVDCDGQEGIRDFESLASSHGGIPQTVRSNTPGGGCHFLFRMPTGQTIRNRVKISGTNIDLRADGGYIIVPPSTNPTGRQYEFVSSTDIQPAEAPEWLLDFVMQKNTKHEQGNGSSLPRLDLRTAAGALEGQRHDLACRLIGSHLARGETLNSVLQQATEWNKRNSPPLPHEEVRKIANDLNAKEHAKGSDKTLSATQQSRLLGIAGECKLFRATDGETFATIKVRNHEEFWPIKGRIFRKWLIRQYRVRFDEAPRSESLNSAIDALDAGASFDGEVVAVFVRVGSQNGSLYLDLCDEDWRVVEINSTGWKIISDSPVRFRRSKAMLSLPTPITGTSFVPLREILNLDGDTWPLIAAWLVAALHPKGPFPILAIYGEQGTSKSMTTRMLRGLIDPSKAPLRSEPRNEQDLMIAAKNSWCLAFDNLSKIPPWLSDALCRLSTGGAFGARQLYTDTDEILIEASRPLVLTSIGEVATRSDLLDRCIVVQLPPISPNRRRSESDVFAAFESARPTLLGALLDAVVTGLQNLPTTKLTQLPRMADFACWVTACEPALELSAGEFLKAYANNRAAARSISLESSVIFNVLRRLFDSTHRFEGTAAELLEALNNKAEAEIKAKPNWPGSARYLADRMRELAPDLRDIGYRVEERQTSGTNSRKVWMIESSDM